MRARELVALAVALVVLVVGQLPGYARAGENTCAPRIAVREARDHDEGKLEMARGKGTTAPRYSGNELHGKVLEAAEAEVVRRHAESSPLTRPAAGWASWARTVMGLGDWQGWHARYIPKRAALAKALREARAEADVWLALTNEDPALKAVRLDLPREEPAELRAERLALIAERPDLAELLTWRPAEWPTAAASEKEKATLAYRLEKLGEAVGPTWYRQKPTNRDLALLVILSGWISDAWKGEKMTIGDAIEVVVSAVRTHRRASAKH